MSSKFQSQVIIPDKIKKMGILHSEKNMSHQSLGVVFGYYKWFRRFVVESIGNPLNE